MVEVMAVEVAEDLDRRSRAIAFKTSYDGSSARLIVRSLPAGAPRHRHQVQVIQYNLE
ncbi:hypothetical protein [Nostoc sp. NMS8]|uniref:hypothetical protein n=1 Tax=Nostoc sp. NMS8 TaxID=2815392 RepID=UPI0025DC25EB|nr:hypothetical protein [Nostoc sp. NMS8]MBN3957338.1 hypothetical protein [Nostoc sp. NMS8]